MALLLNRLLLKQEEEDEESGTKEIILAIITQAVLFFLILGFAATIHIKSFCKSLKSPGIFIGLGLQLVVMPLVGFGITKIVEVSEASTITFMILLSSPGGAFSNFLNSIFNGDLSLSIAMTTVSTLVSLVFLPLNLILYLNVFSRAAGDDNVADQLDWDNLAITCSVLVAGVLIGLYCNHRIPKYTIIFYRIANICGIVQIGLAFVTSNNDSPIWEKPPEIFAITASASLIALLLALAVSLAVGLEKPAVFSVVIEVAVQNSAVAIAFAFAAFTGEDLSTALAIPVVHGMATTLYTVIFSSIAYKAGWTYSPDEASLWQSLVGFHQPGVDDDKDGGDTEDFDMEKEENAKPETDLSANDGIVVE